MSLGNKIKNIRYNNNISQEELSKILGINRNYLSRIETNKSYPTADILSKIAIHFNLSVDSLLEINLDSKDNSEIKKMKLKKINHYCLLLSNKELDFLLNMLAVMTNNQKESSKIGKND